MANSTQKSLPDGENKTKTSNDSSAEGVVEWACPFCDQVRERPNEVRKHITQSADGDHMGESGWSVSEDIVGYTDDGRVHRVIKGLKTPEEEDTLEHGDKKKQIVNAWLANPWDHDVDVVTQVTDATRQYTGQILKKIHEDEFTDREIQDLQDDDLQEEFGEQMDEILEEQNNMISANPDDVEEDEPVIDLERGEGRPTLYNAYMLAPDITPEALGEVLSVSESYAEQVFGKIERGDISPEEVEEEFDENAQEVLMGALESIGALEYIEASVSDTVSEELKEQADAWPRFDGVDSKEIIVNSWMLANERDADLDVAVLADAAYSTESFVEDVVKDLERGDIPQYEIEQLKATDLQNSLKSEYLERGYLEEVEESEEPQEAEEPEEPTAPEDLEDVPVPEHLVAKGVDKTELPETAEVRLLNLVALGVDVTNAMAGDVAGCSAEHARQTLNKARDPDNTEITQEDIKTAEDVNIKALLHARLKEFGHPGVVSKTDKDLKLKSISVTDDVSGVDADIATTAGSELSDDQLLGKKRERLLNLALIDVDLSYADAADVVGCSEVYAGRILRQLRDEDNDEVTLDDAVGAYNENIQRELQARLHGRHLLPNKDLVEFEVAEESEVSEETEEPQVDEEVEDVEEPEEPEEPKAPEVPEDKESTTVASAPDSEEDSLRNDVEDVLDRVRLMRKQAAATEEDTGTNNQATFIAETIEDELEEVLNA